MRNPIQKGDELMNATDLLMVHTTCADRDEAEFLARSLVEARLAACASIGAAVRSVYSWDGAIEHDEEVPLMVKTTRGAFEALKTRLVELHSYDVPEILAVEVVDGHAAYMNWARDWIGGTGQ